MPGIARLNAGVVRIGRQLAKRRNIMWRLEFDLSLEQNSPDQPEKRVQNGRSATPLIVISRFELPLLGSNQDSPDPESGVLPITPRGKELAASSKTQAASGADWRLGVLPRTLATCGLRLAAASHGAEGARTPDLLGAIQALSQLSYSPVGSVNLEAAP